MQGKYPHRDRWQGRPASRPGRCLPVTSALQVPQRCTSRGPLSSCTFTPLPRRSALKQNLTSNSEPPAGTRGARLRSTAPPRGFLPRLPAALLARSTPGLQSTPTTRQSPVSDPEDQCRSSLPPEPGGRLAAQSKARWSDWRRAGVGGHVAEVTTVTATASHGVGKGTSGLSVATRNVENITSPPRLASNIHVLKTWLLLLTEILSRCKICTLSDA